jgi:hypothetical protein
MVGRMGYSQALFCLPYLIHSNAKRLPTCFFLSSATQWRHRSHCQKYANTLLSLLFAESVLCDLL